MKYRLLTPGPTTVPERVLLSMSGPIIHHRTAKFEKIFEHVQVLLCELLNERTPPLILTSSGTGAMESAFLNFFNEKDKVLCVTGGKFADNWLKMAKAFGLLALEIPVKWGDVLDIQDLEKELLKGDIKAVVMVASETSTGVRQPFEEAGKLVKKLSPNTLFIVDAVTAVGILDICPSRDNIDILVFGSQKGLMLPPGLSFIWYSDFSKEMKKTSKMGKFYFDLEKEEKAQKNFQTAHTPAVSLIIGLLESLLMMKEEGFLNVFKRHERLSKACIEGFLSLNFEIFSKNPSPAITCVYSPKSLKEDSIVDFMASKVNFTIAGGQESLKGKVLRVGHMGYVDELDLIAFFGSLEIALKKLGVKDSVSGIALKAMSHHLINGF